MFECAPTEWIVALCAVLGTANGIGNSWSDRKHRSELGSIDPKESNERDEPERRQRRTWTIGNVDSGFDRSVVLFIDSAADIVSAVHDLRCVR